MSSPRGGRHVPDERDVFLLDRDGRERAARDALCRQSLLDKLAGKLALMVDLVTGNYAVNLSGGLTRYLIPGLGIVDVSTREADLEDVFLNLTRATGTNG